jgi:hypothetical protein
MVGGFHGLQHVPLHGLVERSPGLPQLRGECRAKMLLPSQDCQSIQDPQARLACYDKGAKSKQPTKKTKATDEFAAAKQAMLKKLVDPESARWGDFWHGQGTSGPVVCGFVNAKNRMGGYNGMRGFVYVPASRSIHPTSKRGNRPRVGGNRC